MDKSFVEVFEYFRDRARNGTGPYDHAQVMAAKRDYIPPTPEMLDMRRRAAFREPPHRFERSREGEKLLAQTRRQNHFMRAVTAQLGGNLATKAEAPKYDGDALRRLRGVQDRPLDNTVEGVEGWKAEETIGHNAKREHILDLLRLGDPDYQPTWIDVVECFGSYQQAWEHLK